ncbi:phosphoribosylglycinamide synthetase [Streptomyces heilongjiangensis]|uniref:Phosphoribosylglycinamide synthetase n=1 Tax=Streptomyces heilongjiangensis TaxID=945052 RepID=A0ABW1BG98_9ACTN|nr:phosphoribosylglycinamide synthetase [Streptomyces heilongjiangensis]MDC2948619.1 phosphoribosylglycinamide synthetase [Streptomyces heilongjiangensis]
MAGRIDDRRLLLVLPRYRVVRKAVAAGFDVWSLWDPGLADPRSLRQIEDASHELLLADHSDEQGLRALVRATVRRHGIGHVLHLSADDPLDLVLPALEEGWRLGRAPNPPSAVRALSRVRPAPPDPLPRPGPSGPVPQWPGFSVQAFSTEGRHQVIGVTVRRGTGHLHPAPPAALARAAVDRLVSRTLDAAGHRFGPAHFEVAATPDGPRVLAARAGLGGDRIPLLVDVAQGLDLEAAVFAALLGKELGPVPEPTCFAAIDFFRVPAGRLRTVAGIDSICALPYTQAVNFPYSPGDSVPFPDGTGNGYVVVSGATAREAARRSADAVELLRVDVREEKPVDEPVLEPVDGPVFEAVDGPVFEAVGKPEEVTGRVSRERRAERREEARE